MATRKLLAILLFVGSSMLACVGSSDGDTSGADDADGGTDDSAIAVPGDTHDDAGLDSHVADAAHADAVSVSDAADASHPDASSSDTGTSIDVGKDTAPVGDAGPSSSRLVARPHGTTTAPNGFYEYLPPGYSATGATSPLMVFWHGLDEDGDGTTQLDRVLKNGPPRYIKANTWPASRPFVVLSPQNDSGCPSSATVKGFLTWAIANYHVDPARIYLTGLSCGAIGSWNYLANEIATTPIAAAVLISGNGTSAWDRNGCSLGRVAIWAFHGDSDGTVATTGTTYPMTKLLACPAPPRRDAQMTIYPGVGHDAWSRTFDLSAGHDVYAWLLDNHL